MAKAPFIIRVQVKGDVPQSVKDVIHKWIDAANSTIELLSTPDLQEDHASAGFDMSIFALASVHAPLLDGPEEIEALLERFREALIRQNQVFHQTPSRTN